MYLISQLQIHTRLNNHFHVIYPLSSLYLKIADKVLQTVVVEVLMNRAFPS
jgi:hypothetical protein